jgi:hypothetical protein
MSITNEPSAVAPARKQEQSPRHQWREYVAREVKKLPAPVRGLLFQLYDRMDFRGECWASNEKLAGELDVTPRSVRNYIAVARERGLLVVVQTDRGLVFRATIPSSNVVPIRRDERHPDSGGWNVVSTKAGKPVERPAKSRTLPKVESGEIPATPQETERLRVEDHSSPFTDSSTTSKTFDGLSRQEPSSAITADDREAELRALVPEISDGLRANQRRRDELREKPLPAELRRPRSEWSDLDWSTSRRWQADIEAQMRPLIAEHNSLMAESDRLRDALRRERADLDDLPF